MTGEGCQEGATEVDFWTQHTPPDSGWMARMVDAFNAANPDICVKMTIVPGTETTSRSSSRRSAAELRRTSTWWIGSRSRSAPLKVSRGAAAGRRAGGPIPRLRLGRDPVPGQNIRAALGHGRSGIVLQQGPDRGGRRGPGKLDIANGPPTIDTVNAIADKITKEDASGNYEMLGWLPGGPQAAGNPGAIDQGWHYTWGFANGGSFADTRRLQGHSD